MMSAKAKTTIEVLLLALVAAFVGAMALTLFVDLFWSADPKPTEAFRGAFWGAFLAFIFVRLSDVLNRFYQAGKDSRRALGRIQFNLNEAMSIANDNLFVFEQWDRFYEHAKQALATKVVPVFTNRLDALPGSKDVFLDLGSIGLVNELHLLESSIRKLNDSMETWQRSYQDAKTAFMANSINVPTYLANVDQAHEHAKVLPAFLNSITEEIIDALAATRLLLEDKPLIVKLYNWLNPDKYRDRQDSRRAQEIAKLKSEMVQIAAESKDRINAITGGSQTAGTIR